MNNKMTVAELLQCSDKTVWFEYNNGLYNKIVVEEAKADEIVDRITYLNKKEKPFAEQLVDSL